MASEDEHAGTTDLARAVGAPASSGDKNAAGGAAADGGGAIDRGAMYGDPNPARAALDNPVRIHAHLAIHAVACCDARYRYRCSHSWLRMPQWPDQVDSPHRDLKALWEARLRSALQSRHYSYRGVVPTQVHQLTVGSAVLVVSSGSVVDFEGGAIVNAANQGPCTAGVCLCQCVVPDAIAAVRCAHLDQWRNRWSRWRRCGRCYLEGWRRTPVASTASYSTNPGHTQRSYRNRRRADYSGWR